jgi:hypothetical protein
MMKRRDEAPRSGPRRAPGGSERKGRGKEVLALKLHAVAPQGPWRINAKKRRRRIVAQILKTPSVPNTIIASQFQPRVFHLYSHTGEEKTEYVKHELW